MTPAELAAARAVCEAATPGQWSDEPEAWPVRNRWLEERPGRGVVSNGTQFALGVAVAVAVTDADAAFIAAARTGWPAALDEVERLQAERLSIENLNDLACKRYRAAEAEVDRLRVDRRDANEFLGQDALRITALHNDVATQMRRAEAAEAEVARLRAALEGLGAVTLEGGEVLFNVHREDCCDGRCPIHERSDHHMRGFRQHYRGDRGFMERICPHGIGHPDPDDRYADGMHGCDGCCTAPGRRALEGEG